ncbi:MAG: putative toxin-antitoxin system toxin component, PIN family [Patescibacteria group bacterium]|jgi:hypothetical protein
MRIVPDTNLLIQGLLFRGTARKIINLAYEKKVDFYGSANSFNEIKRVVYYSRFKKYLENEIFSPEKIMISFKSLITVVSIDSKYKNSKFVADDADDDEFIRIAKTVQSKFIISSDKHLKNIKKVDDIRIVEPEIFLKIYPTISGKTFF